MMSHVRRSERESVISDCLVLLITLFTDVTYVPVYKRSGRVEAVDIIAAVRPNTIMVTVMLANNETGVIQVHITTPFLPQHHHGDCDASKQRDRHHSGTHHSSFLTPIPSW